MTRRTVHDLVAEARAGIEELTVEQLQAEIAEGTCVVVDVRDFRERIDHGAIPGSISVPRGMVEFWFDPESPYHRAELRLDARYVLYCAGAMRSALATAALHAIGFADVAHLLGGFEEWAASGAPVEPVGPTANWVRRS